MRFINVFFDICYFFYDLSCNMFFFVSSVITSFLGVSIYLLMDSYSNMRYGIFAFLLILSITSWFITISKYKRKKEEIKKKTKSFEEFEKTGIFDEPVEVIFFPDIIKYVDEDYDESFVPFYALYELNNFQKKVKFYAVLKEGKIIVMCKAEDSDKSTVFTFHDHRVFYEYFKVVISDDNKVKKVHMHIKEKK